MFSRIFMPDLGEENAQERPGPATRKELFRRALHDHAYGLAGMSMLIGLIYLPGEIWTFLQFLSLKIEANDASFSVSPNWLYSYLLILWPCIVVSGPWMAGISRILRDLARGQEPRRREVFFSALRDSWKPFLLSAVISGVIPFFSLMAIVSVQSLTPDDRFSRVLLALFFLFAAVWFLIQPTLRVVMVTYRLSFPAMVWNAFFLTFRRFFSSLGIALLSLFPTAFAAMFILAYPGSIALVLSVWAAYTLFYGYALRLLLHCSYGNCLCERFINIHIPGAKVDIGLTGEYEIDGGTADP